MYERFYGLYRPPFAVTPDPGLMYMSPAHREALATIIYGIETRKGFVVVTGEVGTGKTTVIRAFFDQSPADAFRLIYIFTPQADPLEMAKYICREVGIAAPESLFASVPQLQLKLLEIFESGKTLVLLIDEAQLLPPETLEFLRLLSNFETDTEKLIQIVLVGQPEVDNMLARPDMRQVSQRVALRARLRPLTADESLEYIQHRLVASGASEMTQALSSNAAWSIVDAADGIPRRINILADNVLIAGFGAGQRPVGSQVADRTIREFIANSGAARPERMVRTGARRRLARMLRRGGEIPPAARPAPNFGSAPPVQPEPAVPEDQPRPEGQPRPEFFEWVAPEPMPQIAADEGGALPGPPPPPPPPEPAVVAARANGPGSGNEIPAAPVEPWLVPDADSPAPAGTGPLHWAAVRPPPGANARFSRREWRPRSRLLGLAPR